MRHVCLTLRPAASQDDYSAGFLFLSDYKHHVNKLQPVHMQAARSSSALRTGVGMAASLSSIMSRQRGQYRGAIRQQMGSILLSGLYSRIDALYACVLGETPEAIDAASELLQSFGAKVSILQTSQDMQQMERLTLTSLARRVQPADRVLYMHSKGISYGDDSEQGMNTYWWTLFMEYHLVQGHARCLDLLRIYDVVGVKWENMQRPDARPGWHFSGNFWWAAGSYLRSP